MIYLRKYYLANTSARQSVDLRHYRKEIEAAIHSIMPQAQVEVCQYWYQVSPSPRQGDAIKIGRLLSSKDILGQHCVQIPKLFVSTAITTSKEETHVEQPQPRNGGHQ